LLVAATLVTNRDSAGVISSARFRLLVDQRTQALALVQPIRSYGDDKSSAR